jgi:hypothetical protein
VPKRLGAPETGYARPRLIEADVFHVAGVLPDVTHVEEDVRNLDAPVASMKAAKPDIASEIAVGTTRRLWPLRLSNFMKFRVRGIR